MAHSLHLQNEIWESYPVENATQKGNMLWMALSCRHCKRCY